MYPSEEVSQFARSGMLSQLWNFMKQAQSPQKASYVFNFPYSNSLATKQPSDWNGASQATCVRGDSTLMQMF